ncbi:MAG TPA: hypothetical protein PKX12_12840 [Spirochaetota bacterium]|nr:hypothetical protein [Spirochaetota bacterium]
MKQILITCMLFAVCLQAAGQEQRTPGTGEPHDKSVLFLQWERVEEAKGYKVQIVDKNNREVLDKITDTESINFRLPNGNYKFRVGVLNVFSKVELWTEWSTLTVKNPVRPEFESLSITQGYRGMEIQDIQLQGKNIQKEGKIFLTKDSAVLTPENLRRISENSITFNLNLRKTPPGEYNLILENPGGARIVSRNIFTVVDPQPPVFESMLGRAGNIGSKVEDIIVKGDNFKKGAKVFLKNNQQRIQGENIIYESKEIIRFDVNLLGKEEGKYDLVIENPDTLRLIQAGIFTVNPTLRHVLKNAVRNKYPECNWKIRVDSGYQTIRSKLKTYFNDSSFNFNAAFGSGFSNINFLKDIPVITNSGCEAELMHSVFEGKTFALISESTLTVTSAGLNLYYSPKINFAIRPVFRIGGGLSRSVINVETSSGSHETQSRDPYYKAGISLEYRFTHSWFCEGGIDYMVIQYLDEQFESLRYFLGIGYMF